MSRQQRFCLQYKLAGKLGGSLTLAIRSDRIEGCFAGIQRIGIRHMVAQSFAAKDDDEPVFLDGRDLDGDAGNANLIEAGGQWSTFFRGNTTGTTIGDEAFGVRRTKVAARGDFPW